MRVPVRQLADFADFLQAKNFKQMKKIFGLLCIVAILWSCSKEKNNFTISGVVTNAEGQWIYLDELKVDLPVRLDSMKINKRGEFKFEGSTNYPRFYLLKMSPSNFITLLADSAEHIKVSAGLPDFSLNYTVEGGEGAKKVQELSMMLNHTLSVVDSLRTIALIHLKDPDYKEQLKKWNQEYEMAVQKQVDFSTKFVRQNPFSMATIMACYQKFDDNHYVIQDLQSLKIAASALKTVYPNSEHVNALYNNTMTLIRREQNQKLQAFIEEYGLNSPDIVLPNMNGEEVALSSFRGKVVLVHFWSALDRNSRFQNDVLKANFKKYRSKGFDIYQVSIDTDKEIWKKAIADDGLTWTNVGDMKGSNSALINYNVQLIPSNYLLDKEGNVLAKNLAGPKLDEVLSRIFD